MLHTINLIYSSRYRGWTYSRIRRSGSGIKRYFSLERAWMGILGQHEDRELPILPYFQGEGDRHRGSLR
jgi:hypothetical protein